MHQMAPVLMLVAVMAVAQVTPAERDEIETSFARSAVTRGDYGSAISPLKRLADRGSAWAQDQLGNLHANGRGVPQDYLEAIRWYRLSAAQGYAESQFNLGYAYETGKGVQKNSVEAAKWYWLAAVQGLASAQNNLGVAYEKGLGVARNDTDAVRWYRQSAEQGWTLGQLNLGSMYANGRGVAQDSKEAMRWWNLAAASGLAAAQANLGWAYVYGKGTPVNIEEALKWLRAASAQGDDYAKELIAKLSQGTQQAVGGVYGSAVLWSDSMSGEYSFTVINHRTEDVANIVCQVVFFDFEGTPIDTADVRYEGTIPAGLSKRITGTVDPSVHRFQAARVDYRGRYLENPKAKREVRVIGFDIIR